MYVNAVSKAVPPLAAVYQMHVVPLAPALAEIVTEPDPHLSLFPAVGTEGIAPILAVTLVLVVLSQPVMVL